jgi:D-alanyl-D-alanine carboxypeptidase
MFTSYKIKSGRRTQYGYGMGVSDFEGYRLLEHSGGIFGFSTDMGRIPEKGLMVAILTNSDSPETPPGTLVRRILAKAVGKPEEDRKTVQLDAATLDEYVGVYRFDEQTTRTVTRDGGKLFSQRSGGEKQEILATAKDDFFFKTGGSRIHFRRDAQGKVTGADFTPGSGPEETGAKTNEPLPQERQPVKLDPAVYDAYVGEYELSPNFSIAITREGDQIFAKPTGQPKIEIFPESETLFFLKVVDARLEFVRGADGKATSVILHQGGRDRPGKRK